MELSLHYGAISKPEDPDLLMEMGQYEGGSLTRRQWRNVQPHK